MTIVTVEMGFKKKPKKDKHRMPLPVTSGDDRGLEMKNTAEFVSSHSKTRGAEHNRCSLCHQGYDKWTYQYVKVVSGPAEGGVICPDCLKSRDFSERAEVAAKEYEAQAKVCISNAKKLRQATEWDVPTFEEWAKCEKAADVAYCKENYPEEWKREQAAG